MRVAWLLWALSCSSILAQNALPNPRPPYAPRPTDKYWGKQWYLDNRNAQGARVGPDLNPRGAWQRAKGEGVVVAIVDDGVEAGHRDLKANRVPELDFDF